MVMIVKKIDEMGAAATAGLKVDDLLISLQGIEIDSDDAFADQRALAVASQSAKVFRDGNLFEVGLPEGKLGLYLTPVKGGELASYKAYLEAETKAINSIPFFTSESVGNQEVLRFLGTARGSTVRAKHIGRDFAAGLKNIVGGEIKGYTELMAEGREEAIWRMKTDARRMGANMIIASRFSSAMIDVGACEITAYGTAVVVRED